MKILKADEGISAENAVMFHGALIVSIRRADNETRRIENGKVFAEKG
jgi:hypothetical protein